MKKNGQNIFRGEGRAGFSPPSEASRSRATKKGGLKPALLDRRLRSHRAFTLVELLVAATITALIAGFVAAIVAGVSKTWTRAGNRLGTDAQARIVLDQLQIDLQGALFRDDGNVWLAADVLNGNTGNAGTPWMAAQRNAKPAGSLSLDMAATRADLRAEDRGKLEYARFGIAGVWLRFFTTRRGTNALTGQNATASLSAPVAVSYQIVRRFTATNPANQNTGYLLHRVETRPATANSRIGVLEAGYNITAADYTTRNANNNNGSQTGDPRTIQVVTTNPRNLDSVIADNVIDFGVRAYVRDQTVPGGLRLIFPANATGGLSNVPNARLRGQFPSNTPPTSSNYNFLFPDVIDVMVRILTDEGATRLADMEKLQTPALTVPQKYNNSAPQWWWGVAEENSHVYTRRIVLNAKSL
jgi:prepilin-type N-terminal cleavage/methylation domain-containing protein